MEKYTYQLHLDTKSSINKSTTSPMWILNNNISQINNFSIKSFTGVNNLTNVNTNNKSLYIYETKTSVVDTVSSTATSGTLINLSTGNYTISSFVDTLQQTLNATATYNYSINLNTRNNIISMSCDDTSANFCFATVGNSAYDLIGIKNSQLVQNYTIGSNLFTCGSNYDLSGIKTINICSSNLGFPIVSNPNSSLNIIHKIPIDDSYMSVLTTTQDQFMSTCNANNVSSIQLSLYDEDYKKIPETFADWSLTMYIQTS